eukprot:542694-Prymnesium_polylepis.1
MRHTPWPTASRARVSARSPAARRHSRRTERACRRGGGRAPGCAWSTAPRACSTASARPPPTRGRRAAHGWRPEPRRRASRSQSRRAGAHTHTFRRSGRPAACSTRAARGVASADGAM